MIQYVTEIKYMPPWSPNKEYSHFVGERGLTNDEIQLITDWVSEGSPQGDPNLEPPLPDFPSGSQLGTPDLVLEMSEDYFIEGNNTDDYRVFVLPTGLTEDKEIAAVEFRPGNTKAVHHALLAYETNGAATEMDASTPEYGYEQFGSFGVQVQGNFIGYTPGISTVKFPPGIGVTLQLMKQTDHWSISFLKNLMTLSLEKWKELQLVPWIYQVVLSLLESQQMK